MVDFGKLRKQAKKPAPIEPLEIFRRLPKPQGINDLYTSQAEVLENWFSRRTEKDIVVKLHTGGGKTLVGLLMAQSTLNEIKEPVLYLAPNRQLVAQTLEKAKALGIAAVPYERGQDLSDDFLNSKAIMVATYSALFNGRSKFGVRGTGTPLNAGAIVFDDAHATFSVVRDSFTLEIDSKKQRDRYENISALFRKSFQEIDKIGTFDDTITGTSFSVLEVPYWAWHEQLDAVREQLRSYASDYPMVWPFLRDNLHLCHAIISKKAFTITPILPLINLLPTLSEATRRIYMSATIADDSEIIRTFDADPGLLNNPLTSRSLAGISERMILIPDLMPTKMNIPDAINKLLDWTAQKGPYGAIVLVPSDHAAENRSGSAVFADGPAEVELRIQDLLDRKSNGPFVFSNRYDGIDLPGDACRLLVMEGLPTATSNYELLRGTTLYGGLTINRMLAQRIEQGIGRGARGSGDYCVVILAGSDLAGWVAKDANFRLLTSATRAQLDMGSTVSKEISSLKDLAATAKTSYDRDTDWIEYHAETLAEELSNAPQTANQLDVAAAERKAFNLWIDGYHGKAIAKLEKAAANIDPSDNQTRGWLQQLAGRIANEWGQFDRSNELQREAYANNKNLLRPPILPPYRPLIAPSTQAKTIATLLKGYRFRRGFLQSFEKSVSFLNEGSSAGQFEQALVELGETIGLTAERHDSGGQGPDVLWLLPEKHGFIIEAKSRKKAGSSLTKENHGQLLVAQEWFKSQYPDYSFTRICVHPTNKSTKAAAATESFALTYECLASLISDARSLLTELCESQLSNGELEAYCNSLLDLSDIRHDRMQKKYLRRFVVE